MQNMLVADTVSKFYGKHKALSDVSLEIPENSIYGLLGPNGAGKTTFIRIINQITFPDEGQILFKGKPLHPKDIARIGYLPEERGLYKSMKVGEQALYLSQLKGVPKAEAKKRLKEWFDRFEIGPWWNKKIQELSKGMAQKVQFIVTVLHEPELLIFDEPFSGFDPINANLIKNEILRLKENGTSIIFSTHRMESVEELCEHIALIHKSEKILDGKLSDIKKAYRKNRFTVDLKTNQDLDTAKILEKDIAIIDNEYVAKEEIQHLTLQLPCDETREVLHLLSDLGTVYRFEEVVPTVNEIFIQTVNEREQHG